MSYRIQDPSDILDEVRRIGREQLEEALSSLAQAEEDPHEAVHDVRKRCKKLRGLVRLVRPPLGEAYGELNRELRDAARLLSGARDAHVAVETFDLLMERHREGLDEEAFEPLRSALLERREEIYRRRDLAACLDEAEKRLRAVRRGIDGWTFEGEGFGALAGGLEKTHRRFRKRSAEALESPTTERLHEWRKRAKYHRYHVRLMVDAWPGLLDPLRSELHRLTDLLGDDHDVANLALLLDADGLPLTSSERSLLLGALEGRRRLLQRRAFSLGRRLAADPSAALVERLGRVWSAWQRDEERASPARAAAG